VLKNYTTFDGYFKILQTTEDKVVQGKKASRALMKYVETHTLSLSAKSQEIVEHFRIHCKPKIGGTAKAMVVASSRLQALRYKQEIDAYIQSKNYLGIKTMVAFSGSLTDQGQVYTEQNLNGTKTEREFREQFNKPEYNILIVAEKYQTGYDQPLLHTMYVDKKLHGIKVVQTLSRLNRTSSGKTDTFVVDFQNDIQDISGAFEPYYKGTILVDKTDPNYLFSLYNEILGFKFITIHDLDEFAKIFFKPLEMQLGSDLGKLYSIVDPVVDRFLEAKETEQDEFKVKLAKFIEAYSFLSQVIYYGDTNLEKLNAMAKFVANENRIKGISSLLPELKGDISLQYYKLQKTHEGDISLGKKETPLIAGDDYGKPKTPEVLTTLSDLIQLFNERFSDSRVSDSEIIEIDSWLKNLENNSELRKIAQVNEFDQFRRVYEKKLENQMLESLSANQSLISKIYSDPDLKEKIIVTAAEHYHKWAKANNLPPVMPDNPIQNRATFREIIKRGKGFVHLIDMYFNSDGVDFVLDSVDKKSIKEIKILSSLYDNEYAITEKLYQNFKANQAELGRAGISLEMRVISSKAGHDRVSHDRFLLAENIRYNIPSYTTIIKGRFSEFKRTTNDIPFEKYWNDPDSLDLVRDWDKIRKLTTFDVTCSDCGAQTQVHFKPDGKRPVYCSTCYQKHRKH
jgi:type I restriction enzyme R subunit